MIEFKALGLRSGYFRIWSALHVGVSYIGIRGLREESIYYGWSRLQPHGLRDVGFRVSGFRVWGSIDWLLYAVYLALPPKILTTEP